MTTQTDVAESRGVPNGPEYPLVVVIADGWSRQLFLQALDDGLLPEIQDGFAARGGIFPAVVSNLPSVSIASHASILCARYQDEHGIPGHRWVTDSGGVRNYLRMRGPHWANLDLSPQVQTIFEAHPAAYGVSVQGVIRRGADRHVRLATMRSGPILRATAEVVERRPTSVVVTWLPRVDALAHIHGPAAEPVLRDMIETSRAFGAFFARLERAGVADRVRVLMIPDHGHRTVERRADLRSIFAGIGMDVTVNPRRRTMSADAVICTNGDSAASVYLDDAHLAELPAIAEAVTQHSDVELACWFSDNTYEFASRVGRSRGVRRGELTVDYSVLAGVDPLGLLGEECAGVIDLAAPIVTSKYPDFLHQFSRSRVPGRSGNLLILAARNVHFGCGPRIGYRLGYHRGSHGGPFEEEIMVAAAYRGDLRGVDPEQPVRSAELLRTLGFLDGDTEVAGVVSGSASRPI